MAIVVAKRKLNRKSIKEKYDTLKGVEEGSSKSQVAMKYGIPNNTLSTCIKNKDQIFESMRHKGANQDLEDSKKEHLHIWLLTLSRNVVVSTSVMKTKTKELVEKINIRGFQAPDS